MPPRSILSTFEHMNLIALPESINNIMVAKVSGPVKWQGKTSS